MYYWVNLEKCWEDFKQIAATTSTTEVVDAESWENRPTVFIRISAQPRISAYLE